MKYFTLIIISLLAIMITGCSSDSDRTNKDDHEPIRGSLEWCYMYYDPASSGERKPNAAKYCKSALEKKDDRERNESILNDGAKVEIK